MENDNEPLTPIEAEVINVFVRGVQLVGLPKSIGEIYGYLFISPEPVSMDKIKSKLNISVGSASQGLRQLKSFRAIKATYVAGERKDYYVAETEFRKLIYGFFNEEIKPQVDELEQRLIHIKPMVDQYGDLSEHYKSRLDKVERWRKLSSSLIGKVITFVNI